jgi:erythromycin esterase-like protein
VTSKAIKHAGFNDWISKDAIAFSTDSTEKLNSAISQLISQSGSNLQLLGLGEALHGDEILGFRNRLFMRLVEAHGFTAIAIESSFPRARVANEFILGRGAGSYDLVQEAGFSHGFGANNANRELIEWMREYNRDPSRAEKIHFYGFDSPTEMTGTDSPRQLLRFVLDYLDSVGCTSSQQRRQRIEALIGEDQRWEDPAAMMDPGKSFGATPEAASLRLETEELICELRVRQADWIEHSGEDLYLEALQYAKLAREFLTYHAGLATPGSDRTARLLGIRDLMMADNLQAIVSREHGRLMAFAHNMHLKFGPAQWQLGPDLLKWSPAGVHLRQRFGSRYVVIGSAVGVSEASGIAQPEPGTLESWMKSAPGPSRFLPTHSGKSLPQAEIESMPTRSGSSVNFTYFPHTPLSFREYDWLLMLD